ncbi:MAG: molybdopterin oxidoreductase, partial [Cyanobacteria bacterium REEB65]|nr:molybdopterin oxidoreductase [Cyanobacteria bacterium REEB65]
MLAFGREVDVHYRFDRADVIVSLDADFLLADPGSLRYARDYGERRRLTPRRSPETGLLSRLYVVEPSPSITGAAADHRIPLKPSQIEGFARALAIAVGVPAVAPGSPLDLPISWLEAIAADLQAHRGHSLVLAGRGQPGVIHALAYAMNAWLQNLGDTAVFTDPIATGPFLQVDSLVELVGDMQAGMVRTLYILDNNVVYNTPADLRFSEALARVPRAIYLGTYADETAACCHWQVPMSHPLESWGDLRAYDGTISVTQPTLEPLYDTRTAIELMASLVARSSVGGAGAVRAYWQGTSRSVDFDRFWDRTLRDGFMAGTAALPVALRLRPNLEFPPTGTPAQGLEISFIGDPTILDGRYANNGWLQELPKPLSKVVWDNAAYLSPATAAASGVALPEPGEVDPVADQLKGRDVVALSLNGRTIELPVYVLAGQADGCVTVHLGYGRRLSGSASSGRGADAYEILPAHAPGWAAGLAIARTGRTAYLAMSQHHATGEGRHEARCGTFSHYLDRPDFAQEAADRGPLPDLYPPPAEDTYRWGMAIDLQTC